MRDSNVANAAKESAQAKFSHGLPNMRTFSTLTKCWLAIPRQLLVFSRHPGRRVDPSPSLWKPLCWPPMAARTAVSGSAVGCGLPGLRKGKCAASELARREISQFSSMIRKT